MTIVFLRLLDATTAVPLLGRTSRSKFPVNGMERKLMTLLGGSHTGAACAIAASEVLHDTA
jgi:hypothetical protein